MASFDRCSFKIVWIVTQVMLHLASPYVTFSHFSQLHPSENPDCSFRSSKDHLYDRSSKYRQNYSIGHEPSIEIRAVLVSCQGPFGKILDERSRVNTNDTFDEDSNTSDRERIGNCQKKLIITLKLNNVGKIKTEDEYVVVSHVLDPITMQKSRLQNPYVIKIRREPMLQLYRLKFERIVNAEAREQIILSKETNHTRCNDGVENPTCGLLFDNGVPVPFSQGFCCSCNTENNTTREIRNSKGTISNLSSKVETIQEESTNKSSNKSKSSVAYDRPSTDSVLSVVPRSNEIRRKQGHLIYNSRKLKENFADTNLSTIGNTDNNVNDRQKINRDGRTRISRKTKNFPRNANSRNTRKYINKNADNLRNATRTVLFSSKISTKGKIEPYIDAIQEEALRESRNLKDIEKTRSSSDYKNFVIESPLSSKGLRFEKYKKRKTKYDGDRIEDVEPGRKNLMDELTELEKAYEALKKMRSKKGESRSSEKDESYERVREDLQEKELRPVDNIEKNAKKTLSDKRKMKMDARANENKMRETRRCFRLRKTKGTKNSKKKEDREDLNSGKSMGTLTSRLGEFQARSRLGGERKIYEDQSADIQALKKREFPKYPLTKNASIRVDSKIKKCSEETIECLHENEMFALLTRLLVPDEEILRDVGSLEIKRSARKLSALRNNRSTGTDSVPKLTKRRKKSMKNRRKKVKRREKHNLPIVSSISGNFIKNIENDPREKHTSGNIRVYVQRPDFDLVTDKYLNEPSMDFNSSDNPFLINEDPRQKGIDRHIEEKFGRISEVLKEASDEAKNFPLNVRNETSNMVNKESGRINDWKIKNLNISRNEEKSVSKNNQKRKNFNCSDNNVKVHKFNSAGYDKKVDKFTDTESNAKRQNLNVPSNLAKTERNENAVDRIGYGEISSKEVPTTNFVEFKGGTRPLEKVIPHDKSSFSSNPVNGVERYTKRRPGESTDRINVRASNDSKQISDLIISRSRLNSTIVVVDASRPGKNAVSYLDVENSGIVLRKINSSVDTKTKLVYKMKETWKTYGRELISPKNYSDLHVFNESNKSLDNQVTNKDNTKEMTNTKPREVIFYEYNFDDDNNDDDFSRKSRTLLSLRFDNIANQDADELFDDSQNFEYEDYTYPKTDSTKDKNEDDTVEDNSDFKSVNPSKRKVYMDENNYEDFNNIISSDNARNQAADKYIKHMSAVIAHRGKTHDARHNEHENEKYEKIDSGRSKIVKKQVNDVPLYDFISTQEAFNDAKKTKNFSPEKNFNFIPENWNEKMNIDDARIYDEKFDQNPGRNEKSSFVDTSSYNSENDKVTSSKVFQEKPMIEKNNEFLLDSKRNLDETSGNIDISVNGNIHVEGGIQGHPISIAFVALPDTQADSPVISNNSNVEVQKSDDSTNEAVKFNEIVPTGLNDQDYAGSNAESMPNAFPNDLDKSKEESNAFLMNNNNDEELLGRNKSLLSSLGSQNHIYNDAYKYGGIQKVREDQATPEQRVFVFNSKLDVVNADDLNSNQNLESPYAEEYEENDSDDDINLKNLAREKKEAENFDYRMTDEIDNFMDRQSNDSLPASDENVTLIKIIPEKLFDNVPLAMKNDFSNNFEANSYGGNLSSFEFPSLSNPTSMKFYSASDYDNATNKLDSYNLAGFDANSMIFPVVFETTVQPSDIVEDWYKDMTSKEITTISKITEPDALFRKMTTTRLSISDIQTPISKQSDNVTVIQSENKNPEAEKSKAFNETSSTISTTSVTIADSCYKMKVTVKKLNLSETTTTCPTTTIHHVSRTIQNVDQQDKTLNSSQTQNSTIRERNASAITNFIKKLQAFAPDEEKSDLNVREIIVVPENTHKSIVTKPNNCLNSQINSNKDEGNKIRPRSSLENSDLDKSVPIFLSSSKDSPENLRIPKEDSTKENKLRKKTIPESNPKLLSRTSKGSFYSSSRDSSRKEQQHQQSSSGSSTKRSLSGGHDGSDKSFLFYARQKQPVGLPELLVKSQEGNDIDGHLRSTSKRVFLSRNKRNEKNGVGFRNFNKKICDVDEASLSVKEKAKVKSNVDQKKKMNSVHEFTRLPRSDKRKLEKRKKKMAVGEIKKLTGIRRRKKKKKRKKKRKMKEMGNRENTLDIPEVKTKWRLVKRNLLSVVVGGSERGRLKRKLGKKRDDGDLEITRKKYEESNASQVGRVSSDVGCSEEKKRKRRRRKKKKKKKRKVEDAGSTLIRLRQSRTDGKQVRGGQDCSNRDHPVDVDESKYFESAHCLRFSDLWYSVYRLDGPILDHGVSVQLYEKRSLPDGTARWEDLTPSMIRLNTFSRRYRNNDDSLAFTYRAKREPSKQFPASLDILEDRLLVPSTVSSGKSFKVAESKGIFEDYLIVRANEITSNGNECDKIGVGFKAFVDQPDRCGRLEGTCLKYQPLSYWKRDREAREAGRAGCYFLSNFASVPSEPIKYNVSGSGSGEFLALEYHSPHVSAIDIEVRNDYNGVASAGPLGRISHIYVDSTSSVHTLVTIVIRNVGSTPTVYRPRIVECPRGLPVSWSNARGIVQMVLPRQNRVVAFDLYGELPFDDFECTVELLDRRGKIVASRIMKVRKMDRCFCVWHCLCACVGGADGSSCRPMSTAHYRAAGFQPPVPATPMRSSSSFLGSLFDFLLFLFSVLALLLTMGITKWIIGIYVPAVGRWGLDTLLESTRMREYFEEELKCRCIVTDESGLPVHPDTGSRSIRICSRRVEFFLNVTFFLIYPITVCWYRAQKIFRWTREDSSSTSNDESKACLTSDRDEYQNLVTVSTYGDGRNSKMEAEDTNYVMNELKKSQESLQEYNRYKRYRYYMENQDSRY